MIGSCKQHESIPPSTEPTEDTLVSSENSLLNIANRYFELGNEIKAIHQVDSSIFYFQKAAHIYKELASKQADPLVLRQYFLCKTRITRNLLRKDELDAAYELIRELDNEVVSVLSATDPSRASILNELAVVLKRKSKFAEAAEAIHLAIETNVVHHGTESIPVATNYQVLGNIYRDDGRYGDAIEHHLKGLTIVKNLQGSYSRNESGLHFNLGIDYWRKSDFKQSLHHWDECRHLWESDSNTTQAHLSWLYNNIGLVHADRGDYEEALGFLEKSLEIKKSNYPDEHTMFITANENLGGVHEYLGNYVVALGHYQKSLELAKAKSDIEAHKLGEAHMNIASVQAKTGETDLALASCEEALNIFTDILGENHPQTAACLNKIALLQLPHNPALSKANIEKALAIQKALFASGNPRLTATRLNLAKHADHIGETEEALAFVQQAIHNLYPEVPADSVLANPSTTELRDEQSLFDALTLKAELLHKLSAKSTPHTSQLRFATIETYQLAITALQLIQNSLNAQGSKLFLTERSRELFSSSVATAFDFYSVSQSSEYAIAAFNFAEQGRVSVLREAMNESEAKQIAGIPDSVLAKERQLRVDISSYETEIQKETSKRSGIDSSKIAEFKDKLFQLKHVHETMVRQFEEDYPEYFAVKYQTNVPSLADIQTSLDANTAVLEFFVDQEDIYSFVIAQNEFNIHKQTTDSLATAIGEMRAGIKLQDYGRYTKAGHYLYQKLLSPIAHTIQQQNLVIVPDNVLNYLPFEALLTESAVGSVEDYANLPYLINNHAVKYAYSAQLRDFGPYEAENTRSEDFLAVAPVFPDGVPTDSRQMAVFEANTDDNDSLARGKPGALPASKIEIENITKLFSERAGTLGTLGDIFGSDSRHICIENEATEMHFKSLDLSRYKYIHFATHGFANYREPELCGLLFAETSDSTQDNVLHLSEIYNLKLNAELVTLSACETGTGKLAEGEGIIGLARGFIYAGARNLLVSQWKVNDLSTADLMVNFYTEMLTGTPKSNALQRAKRQLINSNSEFSQPYYWAPFILISQ